MAFQIGWAFGSGYFAAGLYWVGIAFLVDAERFGAVMPLAVAGLAVGLGLFPALAVLAVWLTGWRGMTRVLFLGAAWLAAEWLRSAVLTGFPWNLIGTVWSFSTAMVQLAALTGVWGLSLVTVIAAAAPAVLSESAGAPPLRRWSPIWAMLLALAMIWAGGALRLMAAPAPGSDRVEGVVLRLVQPSIDQSLKWKPELRARHVAQQIDLSRGPAGQSATLVIWAETATPFFLARDAGLRRTMAQALPPQGLLLTGAPRRAQVDGEPRLWNSLHALDAQGTIVATYDKHHLVPFGEFIPLRGLFGFAKLTEGGVDFSPGPGPRLLELPGLPPVSPLICYEAIFPGQVVGAGARPGWLLNITNDAWFGTSSGPYQHFASARLRAIEEGLPLVRSANNGISAVVDAYGRVLVRMGLNHVGSVDSPLPRPAVRITMYARLGNVTVLILLVAMVMMCFLSRRFA